MRGIIVLEKMEKILINISYFYLLAIIWKLLHSEMTEVAIVFLTLLSCLYVCHAKKLTT